VLGGGEPPFEVLIDPDAKVVADRFGTKLYPETWFIDPKGVIRARFDAARDWASPLTIDLAESLTNPLQCQVLFSARNPHGPMADLCGETPEAP
jgi:hypothetical protein